jgi:pimeloyl-ACP methyl ester carboxylesterase
MAGLSIPVVYLHGGPGGGTKPENTKYFDSDKFFVVLFDQRGCGDSKPFAELSENTTWIWLLIHGRYDLVCAPEIGWRLHKAWPGSTLEFVPDAGHSSEEPGTALALMAAMDRHSQQGDDFIA